jgi:hypothetical protein
MTDAVAMLVRCGEHQIGEPYYEPYDATYEAVPRSVTSGYCAGASPLPLAQIGDLTAGNSQPSAG